MALQYDTNKTEKGREKNIASDLARRHACVFFTRMTHRVDATLH